MLTEQQVEAYKRDGYLKMEGIFRAFQPTFRKESKYG